MLLWLETKRRRSMLATKSHTLICGESVDFERLQYGQIYVLGVG
jgi:hypothetical protein